MKWKKTTNILVIVVFASFLFSLSYSFWHRITPLVDAQAYDRIAVNLIEDYGFREDRTKSFEFDTSIVRAGPGYEFFLAGIYKVFGHHYEAVWIIQAIIHAASGLLLFFICLLVFPNYKYREWTGIIAAALFGLHPDLIEISAMLMTETLYLFFTILTVYLFVRVYNRPNDLKLSLFLGLGTGIAILTRPPLLFFIPIFLFFYYKKKKFLPAIIFLFSMTVCLIPWTIRNYLIYNQFIFTTLIGQYNLWIGNTLLSNGGQISGGYNALTSYTELQGFFGLKEKASIEFNYFIFNYPFVFIKLCLIRFVRYFSLIRPMGFWFYQTGIAQAAFVSSSLVGIIILFLSGFSGMVSSVLEKKEKIQYYLIALSATAPIALIPTVVQSRYRFQIYPMLAIFGSYFLINLFQKKSGFKKILTAVAIIFLAISFIDSLFFWTTIHERLQLLIPFV